MELGYTIYCCEIDIETFEIREHQTYVEDEEPPDPEEEIWGGGKYEVADYNEFNQNCVYVESLISAERARYLAAEKCSELAHKFTNAWIRMRNS